jgi:hypothetical protein
VIIRNTARWTEISRKMAVKRVNFTKAKQCKDGIRAQPTSSVDFRLLTLLCASTNNVGFQKMKTLTSLTNTIY